MSSPGSASPQSWSIGVVDILETVREFGEASVELVAWEFGVPVAAVNAVWDDAVERKLLGAGTVDAAGETIRKLTPAGIDLLQSSDAAAA